MKRVLVIGLAIILALNLVGCNQKSVSDEALEKMELELENKDYEKALSYIDIALEDEKLEDRESLLTLRSILEDYLLAVEYFEQNDLDLSKSMLENINPEYKKYTVEEDIDLLKEAIDLKKAEIALKEKLEHFRALVDGDSITEAREYYKSIVNEKFTEEQRTELEEIGQKLIDKENLAKRQREEQERKEAEAKKEAEVKSKEGTTDKPYTGEDSWKNYNHKRPDHVNKRIERNKQRGRRNR